MTATTLDTEQIGVIKELLDITELKECFGEIKTKVILDCLNNGKKLYYQKFDIEDPTPDFPYDFSKDLPEEVKKGINQFISEKVAKAGISVPKNIKEYILRIDGDPSLAVIDGIYTALFDDCKGAFTMVYSKENKDKKLLTLRAFWIVK